MAYWLIVGAIMSVLTADAWLYQKNVKTRPRGLLGALIPGTGFVAWWRARRFR